MIIESGIDLVQVLCGSVGDDDPQGLWVVAMDEQLRLMFVEPLVSQLISGVESYVDEVSMFLDEWSRVSYFALAWSQHLADGTGSSWLLEIDERLRSRPEFAGVRMLGAIVFDRKNLYASVPRCAFSLEPDFSDLPRAQSIPGPHGFTCDCPLCLDDRRPYDDYRDDHDDYRELLDDAGSRYDAVWNRWYPPPERAGKRWTRDEETTVVESHFAGLSCFDISILVRRQPTAIASRLNRLGVSSSTVVTPADATTTASPTETSPAPPDRSAPPGRSAPPHRSAPPDR